MIRTALLKREHRSEFDEETESESRAMKVLLGVLHFVASLVVGALSTVVTAALIAGIVALGVLKFVGDLPPEVTVPGVVGSTEHEARETVSQRNLSVGNIRRVYSEDAPPGEVIGASPEVGMTVREGRELTLIVSRGAARVRVPRLIGLHPDEARKILQERGLTPVDAGEVRSSAPEGEIVRQDPPSRQKLAQGERVEFHVSGGEDYGTVVVEGEDGESKRMVFRRLEIVVPAGDALQRVEVKEGYDELETTYSRLHRPGDEVRLDVRGRPGKRIAVIIEGERVFQTQL
jgi:hypothetical protein